jgi:hypothetical protein
MVERLTDPQDLAQARAWRSLLSGKTEPHLRAHGDAALASKTAREYVAALVGMTPGAVSHFVYGTRKPKGETRDLFERALAHGPAPTDWATHPLLFLLGSFPADDAPPAGFLGGSDDRLVACRSRALAERLAATVEGARGVSGVAPVPCWPDTLATLAAGSKGSRVLDETDDLDAAVVAAADFLRGWVKRPVLVIPTTLDRAAEASLN